MTKLPVGNERQSAEAWLISTSGKGLDETRARIADQRRRAARLVPGSIDHRIATEVLLLLQDSLHVLASAEETLAATRREAQAAAPNKTDRFTRVDDTRDR